jgi:thiamine biosynthesis protein ThiS
MKVTISFLYIFFNGELYSIKAYKLFTLESLRAFFNYKKNLIVMEYNGKIIHPENWSTINLKSRDKIEILTIVGGG